MSSNHHSQTSKCYNKGTVMFTILNTSTLSLWYNSHCFYNMKSLTYTYLDGEMKQFEKCMFNFFLCFKKTLWKFIFHYIILVFIYFIFNIVDHEMNIKVFLMFCVNFEKTLNDANDRKGRKFTYLNVDWPLDNLLFYKMRVQVVSSTTFVKIV